MINLCLFSLCHRAYKICLRELFNNEINQIKLILSKNGYPQELLNKTINLHHKSLDKIKTVGPEKCSVTLLVPYVNKKAGILEKNIKQVICSSY